LGLTSSGKTLVVIQLFRLLFGGYLVGTDQYRYGDTESALTVLGIYLLLGMFTTLFLFGRRSGLIGITWLSVIIIIFHTVFTVLAAGGTIEAGLHDPLDNWWATLLRYIFFLSTIIYVVRVRRENRKKEAGIT
jgi:ABC-type polysaccharide/polyol phosphate export permease